MWGGLDRILSTLNRLFSSFKSYLVPVGLSALGWGYMISRGRPRGLQLEVPAMVLEKKAKPL